MTDTQLLVLAIAIVFPVSVLIYAVAEAGSRIARAIHESERHKNS